MNPFNVHDDTDSDSNISYFSDSSFDSDFTDEEHEPNATLEFDPNKPLPPKPNKTAHQVSALKEKLVITAF